VHKKRKNLCREPDRELSAKKMQKKTFAESQIRGSRKENAKKLCREPNRGLSVKKIQKKTLPRARSGALSKENAAISDMTQEEKAHQGIYRDNPNLIHSSHRPFLTGRRQAPTAAPLTLPTRRQPPQLYLSSPTSDPSSGTPLSSSPPCPSSPGRSARQGRVIELG
jgi:hypothetical protein